MILSKKEKEEQVIKLLNDGLTFKEIAKIVHISLSDISKIKKRVTGEVIEKEIEKEKSIPSQAFQLFKDGKSLVDVAIILDISKEQTIQIFLDYLTLNNMGGVADILKRYRYNLAPFLKWFSYIKKNSIKKIDIAKAIDSISIINILTQQKKNLQKEIQEILEDRDCYLRDLENIKREYYR